MFAFGALLFLVWILLHVFGVALDITVLVLKFSVGLMVVGALVDLFTGGTIYRRFRR